MGVQNPNTTNYEHPDEPNLLNLHKAMQYDGGGKPTIRTIGPSASQSSAFGEPLAIPLTPMIQFDGIYGIDPYKVQTYSALGGSAASDTENSYLYVSSSETLGSYGVLRSRRVVRYRPGQGAMCRFSACFSTPKENTTQRAGFFNQEQAFQVGYNGTEFGLLHSYDNKIHIEKLYITSAPNATQTVTITLNSVAFTVALVNGETTQQTAARIGRATFTGWLVEAFDSEVTFLYEGAAQPLTGTFSYSSTGNVTANLTTAREGQAGTLDWIPISEWNGDYANSNFTLDPTTFNVYQINFRWLGAGEIRFCMENPLTGDFINLHHIHWSNRHTTLHSANPSFKIGLVSYNLGGGSTTVKSGSIYGANEGLIERTDLTSSAYATKSGLSSDTLHHLGTLRNPITNSGKINTREILVKALSVAFQGNDPLNILVFMDTTLVTGTHQFNSYPGILTKASLVNGTLNTSIRVPVLTFTLPINGSQIIDLEHLRLLIPPGTNLSVGVISTQSISQISASIIWIED